MSADNWAICPRCAEKAAEKRENAHANVREQYGKVPAEDYVAALKALESREEPDLQTLREDYSIGISGGAFEVSYRGGCSVCAFVFEYSHEEPVQVTAKKGRKA